MLYFQIPLCCDVYTELWKNSRSQKKWCIFSVSYENYEDDFVYVLALIEWKEGDPKSFPVLA